MKLAVAAETGVVDQDINFQPERLGLFKHTLRGTGLSEVLHNDLHGNAVSRDQLISKRLQPGLTAGHQYKLAAVGCV
ncbi:MAG: hypothetical protein Hals2KO_11250 [Halioglobus sp.]